MGKLFAKRWGMGVAYYIILLIPTLLVGYGIALYGKAVVTVVASVILALILSLILFALLEGNEELKPYFEKMDEGVDWKKGKGIKYSKVFLYLLPELATAIAFIVALAIVYPALSREIAGLKAMGDYGKTDLIIKGEIIAFLVFSVSYWLIYWLCLVQYYRGHTCNKCHCVFSYTIRAKDGKSGIVERKKTKQGYGTIGTVYDSSGNKVGEVKGNTGTYTVTHKYFRRTWTEERTCIFCSEISEEFRSDSIEIHE